MGARAHRAWCLVHDARIREKKLERKANRNEIQSVAIVLNLIFVDVSNDRFAVKLGRNCIMRVDILWSLARTFSMAFKNIHFAKRLASECDDAYGAIQFNQRKRRRRSVESENITVKMPQNVCDKFHLVICWLNLHHENYKMHNLSLTVRLAKLHTFDSVIRQSCAIQSEGSFHTGHKSATTQHITHSTVHRLDSTIWFRISNNKRLWNIIEISLALHKRF